MYTCIANLISLSVNSSTNQFATELPHLLGQLVLDDAHNPAGGLNIHALGLELGKGINSDVLDLDGENVAATGQLSQLPLVVELALEDVLPANDEGGRGVGTGRVQERHGKVEPRCLEGHHSTELPSSDASHAKGERIGGNVAGGHDVVVSRRRGEGGDKLRFALARWYLHEMSSQIMSGPPRSSESRPRRPWTSGRRNVGQTEFWTY